MPKIRSRRTVREYWCRKFEIEKIVVPSKYLICIRKPSYYRREYSWPRHLLRPASLWLFACVFSGLAIAGISTSDAILYPVDDGEHNSEGDLGTGATLFTKAPQLALEFIGRGVRTCRHGVGRLREGWSAREWGVGSGEKAKARERSDWGRAQNLRW